MPRRAGSYVGELELGFGAEWCVQATIKWNYTPGVYRERRFRDRVVEQTLNSRWAISVVKIRHEGDVAVVGEGIQTLPSQQVWKISTETPNREMVPRTVNALAPLDGVFRKDNLGRSIENLVNPARGL